MKHMMSRLATLVRRLLFILICMGAAVLAASLLINQYVISSASDRILLPEEAVSLDADCILILGAAVHGTTPSNMLEDRLLQGVNLYNLGCSKRLLMSGDHGKKYYDEVSVMKQFAIDHDVPSEHIFMDHAGFSTYESMYRAKAVFQADKVIIVTQQYHLYRALYIAKRMGLDAYGVASDLRPYAGQRRRDIREILARNKDFLTSIWKPLPTYVGDSIPVSGNGDVTNDEG